MQNIFVKFLAVTVATQNKGNLEAFYLNDVTDPATI